MAILCRPEMMKLTLPPALMVTMFGTTAWLLLKRVGEEFGKRSSGGELIHRPKLTVALSLGLAAQAWLPNRQTSRAMVRRRNDRRQRFMALLLSVGDAHQPIAWATRRAANAGRGGRRPVRGERRTASGSLARLKR